MWWCRLAFPRLATLVIPAASLSAKGVYLHCQDTAREAPYRTVSFKESTLAIRPRKDYRRLVNDKCVHAIATLINNVVDMPGFSEKEQQDIFETAVILLLDEIAGVLPKSYVHMVRGTGRDSHHVFVRKDVDFFEARLNEFVRRRVRLPFLGESDEKMVIQCVMHVLVTAMVEQKGIEHTLQHHHRTIIVEVFMKSMVGHFVDEEERKIFVQHIVDHIKNLPFVPTPVVEKIVSKVFALIGEVIEVSLNEALDEVLKIHGFEALRAELQHAGITEGEICLREAFIKVVPVLKDLDTEQRARLAEALTLKIFKEDEYIVRRGQIGNEFFILQEGGAKAMIDGQIVMHYGPGSYFGERSLLTEQVRAADVVVTTPEAKLLSLGSEEFNGLMAPARSLLQQLPPAQTPQSEFVNHLRLRLYSRVVSEMPAVFRVCFSGQIRAVVDETLLHVQDDKVEKALRVLISSGELPVHY